jgi:hypothetical protein
MPSMALEKIIGDQWVPLKRESAGRFDGEKLGIPLTVRIDVNGVIGEIGVKHEFPSSLEVARLRVGMTLPEAMAAYPELLLLKMFEEERLIANYGATLADGTKLFVRFEDHKVRRFALSRPGLTYPDPRQWTPAPPGKYPAPRVAPGAPFPDPNFKLVVLDALLRDGVIDLGSPQELTDHVMGRYLDRKTGETFPPARDYLLRYPLTEEHLAAIDTLIFDGGLEIYNYSGLTLGIDGTDCDVGSLQGIERLKNLRRFLHSSMLLDLDLSRLAGLDRLESIDLGDRFASAQTLLNLPRLKELACYHHSIAEPKVVPALEAKGVKITLWS